MNNPWWIYLRASPQAKGAPEATIEYQIQPLHQAVAIYDLQEGLLIKKQIRLSKDGLSVRVRINLINQNPRREKVPAGIRVKCFPRLGSNFAGSKFLPSIFSLNLDDNFYNAAQFTSNTAYNYFPMIGKSLQPYQNELPGKTLQAFKSPHLLLQSRSEGREENLTVLCDPENTAGLYGYYSQTAATVELLSDYVTLPCGESITYQYEITQHEKNLDFPLNWPAVAVSIAGKIYQPEPVCPPDHPHSQKFRAGPLRFLVSLEIRKDFIRKHVRIESDEELPTPDFVDVDFQQIPDHELQVCGYLARFCEKPLKFPF